MVDELRLQKHKELGCGLILFLCQEYRVNSLKGFTSADSAAKIEQLAQVDQGINSHISDLLSTLVTALFTLNYSERLRDVLVDFVYHMLIPSYTANHRVSQENKLQLLYNIALNVTWRAASLKLQKVETTEDRAKFQYVFDCKFSILLDVCKTETSETMLKFKREMLDILDVYVEKLDYL